MALVCLLIFLSFCLISIVLIHWVLKHFFSEKPWHRLVRYVVWLGFLGLLTFDTLYYQIAVVYKMCVEDQKRVYPTPPASLVVVGPYTEEEVQREIRENKFQGVTWWPCIKTSSHQSGDCLLKNVILDKTIKNIRFGGTVKEFIIKNPKTNDIYFRETNYDQYARWADVKICVFGMIWIKQPNSCNRISNTQTPIYLD